MNVVARRVDRRCGTRAVFLVGACGAMWCCGCASSGPAKTILWELARPVDLSDAPRWHARPADDSLFPTDLTERLCEEFALVHVRSAAQWDRLCKVVEWDPGQPSSRPNFAKGSVVGLVARVGEPAGGEWPVRLEEVRLDGGRGWVRFQFTPGLYYPVSGASFFVAAYVAELQEVSVVQAGRRIFVMAETSPPERRHIATQHNVPCCFLATLPVDLGR